MNTVDFILKHPFETLNLEEKLEVKRLGYQRDIVTTQTAGKINRGCNVEWFLKKKVANG